MTAPVLTAAKRSAVAFWVVLLVVLFGVALLAGRPARDGEALAPDATGPTGAKGLVLLLGRLGADVEVTDQVPGDDVDVALILEDRLDQDGQLRLDRWVMGGGTLVVADPGSFFTPVPAGSASVFGGLVESSIPPGECTIGALAAVGRIDPRGGLAYQADAAAEQCYGDADGAFVVATRHGAGTVVAVGGAGLFTNEALGAFDNAVLAGALLAPAPGGRVAFLEPPPPGSGDRTLGDLVAPGVKAALFQLVVAFVVYALWRARRLGAPVDEPQPVQVAGSELVGAVGELLHQSRSPEHAAAVLRDDLRRTLCSHLGLPIASPPDVVATVTAQRTGVGGELVYAAIAGPPLTSDQELVALAQAIDSIRKEVRHGSGT